MIHARKETTGREMGEEYAVLTGEAAGQRLKQAEPDAGGVVPLWHEVPSLPAQAGDYYGLALLKEPVWIWSVPAYFYVGGVAGGGAVLAAALHGKRPLRRLAAWCRVLAFLGTTVGPALLTYDLGRMSRFLNMLRVFRPSSPMSVGSWSLAGTGMVATLALLQGDRASAKPAHLATALGGLMVAGYTGVLLGNSANPLWQDRRRLLPLLFISSAVASTAGVLEMMPLDRKEEGVVQRFGVAGKAGEAACMLAMEHVHQSTPEAAVAMKKGKGGVLWQAAKVALVAGILVELVPGRSPTKRKISGALTTLGAVCLRFALLETGRTAAREPLAATRPQRRKMGW
ncbi:NrfD/PsrC family molybdoenzyme membrane anchor subunit [Geomonas edaphica]|uniref:NrfD/PsrC family molybdoenzyme membrane anchor subunit n=1 Tax=Geomonas edaphica TaxID=2570226 RepID=UPI0013A5F117|nr:NrfD/PsrC family molybdoenzyme membrane anchor subunit [Geomonas edaphica]